MRDYSQSGEQEAILFWAETRRGSFVDLGCYDGETYSNTAALADLGWPGICVDASPDAIAACAERYANRADIQVIAAAFALDSSEPELIHWTPNAMYTGLIATKRPDNRPISILVPAIDLGWLVDRISELLPPLFCSIDLEGNSIEAFHWLLDNAKAECICVEANNPTDQKVVMSLAGWETLFQNNSNTIIARK